MGTQHFIWVVLFSMMMGSLVASAVGAGGFLHARAVLLAGSIGAGIYLLCKAIVTTFAIIGALVFRWVLAKD